MLLLLSPHKLQQTLHQSHFIEKMTKTTTILALLLLAAAQQSRGFVTPTAPSARTSMMLRPSSLHMSTNGSTDTSSSSPEATMDNLLETGKLAQAISLLKKEDSLDIDRQRWQRIFDAIEVRTAEAEENTVNTRALVEYPLVSPARMDMTNMYSTLQEKGHLQVYGAASTMPPPAAGSHIVTPVLLEQITNLTMTALTPKPTPTLLIAGIALAIVEALVSMTLDVNFNLLVCTTILLSLMDKLFTNGAIFESFIKLFSPGITQKITKHEAGHFLCAYLLGCPVEGCVLSSWAALQDARFDKRNVSAGTSFFDPSLSQEMNSQKVTRSSVDRYSIIVMGGIAAEALNFGRADGGAGDEMALVAFLSQLNSASNTWNNDTIRNQARWGALQAVLLLKHYQPCYDALVDALERGGTLGDCIYAIEKAARDYNLGPLKEPLGYILDQGLYGEWTTEAPVAATNEKAAVTVGATAAKPAAMTEEESLQQLQEYKSQVEKRLQDIDDRIKELD